MRVERLNSSHDLSGFSCGIKSLDNWLREHALDNQRRDLSRTYVLIDDSNHVVGYYSLTMGGVQRDHLPKRYAHGLPSFDVGMVLLGRLAVGEGHKGIGLGRDLIIEAVERAADAGLLVAAKFISVDPIDESARSFYAHFGFKVVSGDDQGRKYLRIDEALAVFEDSE